VGIYGDYLAAFAIAAGATFLLVFPVRRLALRFGAIDYPGEDRMHTRPTATIGGAAMFIAFVFTMGVASRFSAFAQIFSSSEAIGIVLGGLVIFLVGLVDDVRNISAPAKVAGQVLAAMVLVLSGVTMYYFKIPFVAGIIVLLPSFLPLITALWVVGMANAVNLIDGLDGLAAGIIAIASGTLCIYGLRLIVLGNLTPDNIGPLVAAIACGVCIGFLPHNFHPARVFMGDGGALFLGLVMAAATMVIGGRIATTTGPVDVAGSTFFRFAPLFIPFFILGVPILDTAFAIVRRTIRRTGVAERDLGHLHHRLVRLGHGHTRAVLLLWTWTAVLCAFVLLPTFSPRTNVFVPFGLAILGIGLYTVFLPGRRGGTDQRAHHRGEKPSSVAAPSQPIPPQGGPHAVTVTLSGAVGVAVAGEPDLASPRKRRRGRRVARFAHKKAPFTRADTQVGTDLEASPSQVARPNDEMRG
jgi:UDP-GlcNAc:undecaprenyl-phosphate GlcNAc-1-phosphate transferase